MFLPFFPLKLVAFPGEDLNLHIFEPRYRQLIAEVEEKNSTFGVCTFIDSLTGFGTEVKLVQVLKRYEDGRLDIKTRGIRAFKINSFQNPVPDKLYSGGDVAFLDHDPKVSYSTHKEYLHYLKETLNYLGNPILGLENSITSFSFAHKVGLKLEEELELLKLRSEEERSLFLIRHFRYMLPILKAAESAKEKIKQNGHVKHLDPLNF